MDQSRNKSENPYFDASLQKEAAILRASCHVREGSIIGPMETSIILSPSRNKVRYRIESEQQSMSSSPGSFQRNPIWGVFFPRVRICRLAV